jgi:hypothetical protein
MPVWRLQTQMGADSAFARDYAVVTPHVDDGGLGTDPQGLCDDWAAFVATQMAAGQEVQVTAYDAQGTKPVYPQGHAILNAGQFPAAASPREVAICLSFYSERSIPSQRGRIYVPYYCIAGAAAGGGRPGLTFRTAVMGWGAALAALGGPDVDWVVYSRKLDVAYPVTDYYVDDEWDTIRSRGLRPVTREAATTSEL